MRAAATSTAAVTAAAVAMLSAVVVKTGIPWEKEVIHDFQRNTTRLPVEEDIVASDYTRTTVHFTSQGDKLEAWLYEPVPQDPIKPPPCVVMGHGLGSQKDMGLHPYAEQFAQAGMSVLVFDYRGFGGSDGAVRHWVSYKRHLQDWQAAVDFVHSGGLGAGRVDASRIALWGVSYSGGHSLVTASKPENHGKVKAVVANEPYLTGAGKVGHAIKQQGATKVLRLLSAAIVDKLRELLNLPPIYVKLVGSYDELAILNMDPKELALTRGTANQQPYQPPVRIGGWKNVATARMLVDNLFYAPIKHVPNIQCPVLFVAGSTDVICPIEHVRSAAQLVKAETHIVEKPYGHIEMHRMMQLPEELASTIDWLRSHLGLAGHVNTHPHEKVPEAGSAEVL